jgi:GDP-4-dehydro-6-deoxy-D-mannose reductase
MVYPDRDPINNGTIKKGFHLSETRNAQPTSFITGINGFVGKHLADLLLSHGRRVVGIDVQKTSPLSNIDYFNTDIRDVDSLTRIFKETGPSEIYHLAAISYPPQFNSDQYRCFEINLLGAVALLDAIKKACPHATVLLIGSSKQYEKGVPSPVSEETPLVPDGFYGISKYFTEIIGRRYTSTYDIDIRYTRSFNHTGPGQSSQFVCSDWARQVALIASNKAKPQISVGNVNEIIDFSDVRDVVEAYRRIVEKGKKGEAYNVCSGKGTLLKYILEYVISKSQIPISVRIDEEKLRTHGADTNPIGDNNKIHASLGWSPQIPLEKTLDDICNWWMEKI